MHKLPCPRPVGALPGCWPCRPDESLHGAPPYSPRQQDGPGSAGSPRPGPASAPSPRILVPVNGEREFEARVGSFLRQGFSVSHVGRARGCLLRTCTRTHVHAHTRTHTHTCAHARPHTHICARALTSTCIAISPYTPNRDFAPVIPVQIRRSRRCSCLLPLSASVSPTSDRGTLRFLILGVLTEAIVPLNASLSASYRTSLLHAPHRHAHGGCL